MRSEIQHFITRMVPLNYSFSIFPTLHHARGLGTLSAISSRSWGSCQQHEQKHPLHWRRLPKAAGELWGALHLRAGTMPGLIWLSGTCTSSLGPAGTKLHTRTVWYSLLHTDNSSWKFLHIRMPHLGNIWKEKQCEIFTSGRCTSQYQQYRCFA